MPELEHQWTDELLDQKRQLADPEADAVLEQMITSMGLQESRLFFDRLIRQIEMPISEFPPYVQDFLKSHSQLPARASAVEVTAAHDFFEDHGPKFLVFLYFKSLPQLYACALGAKVLAHTGRLVHSGDDMQVFSRRIAETGQFLIDVMEPGNLQPGAQGIQSIQKVRLIHAAIRQFVKAGAWNEEAWGLPINQEDMAITLLTFSISLIDGLHQFGIDEEPEKELAYLHTWMAIGELLGVEVELLPNTLDEARLLLQKILERQGASSPEGQLLTAALVSFSRQTLPSEKIKNLPEVLMRYLIGDELAEHLGLMQRNGCMVIWLPNALKVIFNLVEKLEDVNEPIHQLIDRIAVKLTKGMVNFFNEHKRSRFRVSQHLREKWGIEGEDG